MLFNSIHFALFLPFVFLIYWLLSKGKLKWQNLFLLVASYFFYATWNWHCLFLLLFSTVLDFIAGIKIHQSSPKVKKVWLYLAIIINIGFLALFKYYNFFATSFAESLLKIGVKVDVVLLDIILPIGISFYTFHGLSYLVDVYNKKILPEKNFINYSLFVCYFPLLVAGPIERATHLLPQIKTKRNFDSKNAVEGLMLIIWGFFKKLVIADTLAIYVNTIFDNYQNQNSLTLILGAIYFSFQIYGDFSGYSDIAIGVSKLFGIELLKNFSFPYFSRDIAEFWRRWHISLSSWFRDYVYIPLGGSGGNTISKIRNIFIIFALSGFWHGANWTFIVWGLLNACYFLPLMLLNKNRKNIALLESKNNLPTLIDFLQMSLNFILITIAWVFFRSKTIEDAVGYLSRIIKLNFHNPIEYLQTERYSPEPLFLIFVFLYFEWNSRQNLHPFYGKYKYVKIIFILLSIIALGAYSIPSKFIYFQF